MLWYSPDLPTLPDFLCWTIEKPTPDKPVRGVIGAPVVRAPMHGGTPERPCCRVMTKGAVPCFCDDNGAEPRNVGYVPVITADCARVVVRVSDSVYERVKDWPLGTAVQFDHPGKVKRPVTVTKIPASTFTQPTHAQMRKRFQADISEYMLFVFQEKRLNDHFGKRWYPSKRTLGIKKPPEAA